MSVIPYENELDRHLGVIPSIATTLKHEKSTMFKLFKRHSSCNGNNSYAIPHKDQKGISYYHQSKTPVIEKILYNPFNLQENPYLPHYMDKNTGLDIQLKIMNSNKQIIFPSITKLQSRSIFTNTRERSHCEGSSSGSVSSVEETRQNDRTNNDTNSHNAELYGEVVIHTPKKTCANNGLFVIKNFKIKVCGYMLNFKCEFDPILGKTRTTPIISSRERTRVHVPFLEDDIVEYVGIASGKKVKPTTRSPMPLVLDQADCNYIFPFKHLVNSNDFPSSLYSTMGKIEYRIECYLTVENIGNILLTDKIDIHKSLEPASWCAATENGTLNREGSTYSFEKSKEVTNFRNDKALSQISDISEIKYNFYLSSRIIVLNQLFDFTIDILNDEDKYNFKIAHVCVELMQVFKFPNSNLQCKSYPLYSCQSTKNSTFPTTYSHSLDSIRVSNVKICNEMVNKNYHSNDNNNYKDYYMSQPADDTVLKSEKSDNLVTCITTAMSNTSNSLKLGSKWSPRGKDSKETTLKGKNSKETSPTSFPQMGPYVDGLIPYYNEKKNLRKKEMLNDFISIGHFLKFTVDIEDSTTLTCQNDKLSNGKKRLKEFTKIKKRMTFQIPIVLVSELMMSTLTLPEYAP
ncbi:hypothetical protein ACO0QE_003402 [Hanseniaspora vineae]